PPHCCASWSGVSAFAGGRSNELPLPQPVMKSRMKNESKDLV
ncbi:MAG: hypothetical protein ACI8Z1_001335, partial [Candidatus Azotimanducaceae bacterium]